MGSPGNPKVWVPYMNTKDCSQGFCSFYCPQWCYITFTPPPIDLPFENPDSKFSPFVIAIIGILASAFILISYYVIISKYCGNRSIVRRRRRRRRRGSHDAEDMVLGEDDDPPSSNYELWHDVSNGLDETLIKSITLFKYKRGEELTTAMNCSVCLGEFQEDDSLRLLPKCCHAFHVACIDTWLRSHSNCPLCRAVIVYALPLQLPPLATRRTPTDIETSSQNHHHENNAAPEENTGRREEVSGEDLVSDSATRAPSSLGSSEKIYTIIEITRNESQVRRSVSMDFPRRGNISIADILQTSQDEDFERDSKQDLQLQSDVGSSKQATTTTESRPCQRNGGDLSCATDPMAMKRSFSSGRFSFTRRGRGHNAVIPL